jgi:hypothetical protein
MKRVLGSSTAHACSGASHSPDVKSIHVQEEDFPILVPIDDEGPIVAVNDEGPIVMIPPEEDEIMRTLGPAPSLVSSSPFLFSLKRRRFFTLPLSR